MHIKTSENMLRPCECGCETPIIEKPVSEDNFFRVVCPQCKNGEELYFVDSLEGAIKAWNEVHWKWTV